MLILVAIPPLIHFILTLLGDESHPHSKLPFLSGSRRSVNFVAIFRRKPYEYAITEIRNFGK
jgi:hypothetical protein